MKKLSNEKMAEVLGVHKNSISNWKKNKPEMYEIVLKGFDYDERVALLEEKVELLEKLLELEKSEK